MYRPITHAQIRPILHFRIIQTCHDAAAKFVHLLKNPGCNYLAQEDFIPFLQVNYLFLHYYLCLMNPPPCTHKVPSIANLFLLKKANEQRFGNLICLFVDTVTENVTKKLKPHHLRYLDC